MTNTMMTEDMNRRYFRANGKTKTPEDTAKENKKAKDNKKEVREIIKTNKEAIEDMAKATAESSSRLEGQITKIGDNIVNSNIELHRGLANLTATLQGMFANKEKDKGTENTQEEIAKKTKTTTTTTGEKTKDAITTEEPLEGELQLENMDTDKEKEQKEEIDSAKTTTEKNSSMLPLHWSQPSLPNAQSKYSKQRTDAESQDSREKDERWDSSQKELVSKIEEYDQRMRMIETRMKSMEEELYTIKDSKTKSSQEEVKENMERTPPQEDQPPKWPALLKKQPKLVRTPAIDMDGNPTQPNDTSGMEPKNIDWTTVKFPRKRLGTRPDLSQTMETRVTGDLNKHLDDNYRGEQIPKTRPQKAMPHDQRQELIRKMLDRSGYRIGVAPLTTDHMNRVERLLTAQGTFKKDDSANTRKQKTVKALLRSWAMKNLNMSVQEWNSIQIQDITLMDNSDIVFVNCVTKDDVTKFTSRARHLPQESGTNVPRLVMYVDRRAMKRHKAILSIAKSLREHSNNTIQTNVRTGKYDFHVRTRQKGNLTPWTEIAPINIKHNIPNFEIGEYDDIVNPQNNIERELDDKDDQNEPIEDMQEIADEISRLNRTEDRNNTEDQNEQDNNKRERTQDNISQGRRKMTRGKTNHNMSETTLSPEALAEESDDDANTNTNRILNSTPNLLNQQIRGSNSLGLEDSNTKPKEITRYFSYPETPAHQNQPAGRKTHPTIPETPEPVEAARIFESPAQWKTAGHTETTQTTEQEIVNLKTNTYHNE